MASGWWLVATGLRRDTVPRRIDVPDYLDLEVWGFAHGLVKDLYGATECFPQAERYRMQDQLLRAAISIPANIAEGSRRGSDLDFARMLRIALGSASELDYYLLLACDLGYLSADESGALRGRLHQIMRMLRGLIATLRRSARPVAPAARPTRRAASEQAKPSSHPRAPTGPPQSHEPPATSH